MLIADDHPVVRQGIKQILDSDPGFQVLGEAGDASQVLELVGKGDWDVVILDLSMPGAQGLDLVVKLSEKRPRVPILVLSIHPEDQFAMRCLKAGASGYLNKMSVPEDLLDALRCVVSGRRYLSSSLADQMVVEAENGASTSPHELLSERERQVLALIGLGRTIGEIARDLKLSVKTVSTYRGRILGKMGLHSNSQLTRYVFEHGLVD